MTTGPISRATAMARLLWAAVLVLAGLWCSTLLPGVALDGPGRMRIADLLAATLIFCLVWKAFVLTARAALALRDWIGRRVTITWEGELAFPALVAALASAVPGYGTYWDFDVALTGRLITRLGKIAFRLLIIPPLAGVALLDFWLTATGARQLRLPFAVRPEWHTMFYGSLIFMAGYTVAGIVSAFLLAHVNIQVTHTTDLGETKTFSLNAALGLQDTKRPREGAARTRHTVFEPEDDPDQPPPPSSATT